MALFQYQGFDAGGKKKSGLIEAHGEREAKEKLREQSIMVTKLVQKSKISSKEVLKGDNLLAFTIQLSQLINSGIPLYESLLAIEEQYRDEPFHRIILSLCDQIKGGNALSEAMSTYPDSFDKLYCSMITAGESVGALNVVLDRLAELLAKQNKMKKQVGTAMIYPGILACFSVLIIAMLLGFVVPSIEGIFEGRTLNAFTETVLGVSRFTRNYWWIYMPITAGLIVYLVIAVRSAKGKIWIQRNFLKLPLFNKLIVQTSVARFCRTMGTLQLGGLTMIDSLRIARAVMGNVVLEEEIKNAELKIIEGSSLSMELSRSKWIPNMVARMLAVGEDAGTTVKMLNTIAGIYEEELEKTLDRLVALAQPVILIFMGSMIGFVLMAILLPLTDISSLGM